jgi:acyl-CoA reductase-like NAD-dependent aldehyde dehydrogenase
MDKVVEVSPQWTDLANQAKGTANTPFATEDLFTGPIVVTRQLFLTAQTLTNIKKTGVPQIPGRPRSLPSDQLAVPVFPTRGLFDSLTFMGLKAHVRLNPGVSHNNIHGQLVEQAKADSPSGTTVILGAGNVSAIPATDSLNKIMFEGKRVLLKMNPVNDYLTPVFEQAFRPLIDAGLLRILNGDIHVGSAAIHHQRVDDVHVTGATSTHDAIVWGEPEGRENRKLNNDPVLKKKVTSELGNVTPWIIVPGKYSAKELDSQAQHIAASITNNNSFNCLATKVVVTWKDWEQREDFLSLIQKHLDATPKRKAYYPGAYERFATFSGESFEPDDNGCLPYRLMVDQHIEERPELFEQESFVPICIETALVEASPQEFLAAAFEFVNDRVFGTLCCSVSFPKSFRNDHPQVSDDAITRLRYGSVCINQWSGLAYGLISAPWGAYSGGGTPQDVGSGIGNVHNTYLLDSVEKAVLEGPLISFPKPVWFTNHRKSVQVGQRLLALFHKPSPLRLPLLFAAALTG